MTREEVMTLPIIELRAEIAEELGWKSFIILDSSKWIGTSPSGVFYDIIPDWPNSIEAAWKLVENMHECGFHVTVKTPFNRESLYFVKIDKMERADENPPYGVASAETAPLAISRAWLIWKKESEK